MDKIKTQAQKLSEQNSWIRKNTEKLMEKWAEISQCNEDICCRKKILCSIETSGGISHYYLNSASPEITDQYGDQMSTINFWWDMLPMDKLRLALSNLPDSIDEIINLMDEKQKQNDKIVQFLEKMNATT